MLEGSGLMCSAEMTLPKKAIRRYTSPMCTSAPECHTKSRCYFLINVKPQFNEEVDLGGIGVLQVACVRSSGPLKRRAVV
jgi:hypothetical protein